MTEAEFITAIDPMLDYFSVNHKSRDSVVKTYLESLRKCNGLAFGKIAKWFIRTRQPLPSKFPTLDEIHSGISGHIRSHQVPDSMQPERGCSKCDRGMVFLYDKEGRNYVFSCGTCRTSPNNYPVCVYDDFGFYMVKDGGRKKLDGFSERREIQV